MPKSYRELEVFENCQHKEYHDSGCGIAMLCGIDGQVIKSQGTCDEWEKEG